MTDGLVPSLLGPRHNHTQAQLRCPSCIASFLFSSLCQRRKLQSTILSRLNDFKCESQRMGTQMIPSETELPWKDPPATQLGAFKECERLLMGDDNRLSILELLKRSRMIKYARVLDLKAQSLPRLVMNILITRLVSFPRFSNDGC